MALDKRRKLTIEEEKLLEFLIKKASLKLPADWKEHLLVRPMNEAPNGSLYLYPNETIPEGRNFGEEVSDYEFKDVDGVEVVVTLSTDENGLLFELDIWKADFGDLVKFPDSYK